MCFFYILGGIAYIVGVVVGLATQLEEHRKIAEYIDTKVDYEINDFTSITAALTLIFLWPLVVAYRISADAINISRKLLTENEKEKK